MNTYDEKPTRSFLYSLVMGQRGLFPDSAEATVEQLAANAQRLVAIGAAGDLVCTLEKGAGEIGVTPKRRYRDSVEMVFRAVCAGFEMLAQSYPDYIRYEIHG